MSPETRTVAIVPHTHWDREWHQPFQSFRLRLVELLDDLLPRLEADPGYAHFLLDGQLAVVDDHLEVRPEDEEVIRRLAGAGRLSLGPWYTLPDEFLVSGETLIRDLQLGFRRAARFGGAMTVGYLPDMFGHVAQMPQILRQFGMAHAVVWRGVPAAIDRSAFRWEAPDGSWVRAEFLPGGYGNGAQLPKRGADLVEQAAQFAVGHARLLQGGPLLWMDGTDHQLPQPWLGPVVAEANEVGATTNGSGPGAGPWRFEVMSLQRYLTELAPPLTDGAPRWQGELRSGARANLLMGVASNRVDVKQAAARAERALEQRAEPLSALFLAPEQWPERLLDAAWLEVIRNAAHDSVCACSADEVVDAVLHRYAEARQIADGLGDRAARALGASVPTAGPVVLNPSARARSGLVTLHLDVEDEPPGTQTLKLRPAESTLTELASPALAAGIVAELEYIRIYSAARIVDATTGEVLLRAERTPAGQLATPATRERLEAMMADTDPRPCRVEVTQPPGRKVLARVAEVPGYGWRAWESEPAPGTDGAAPGVEPVTAGAGGTTLSNGLVTVAAESATAMWTSTGLPGMVRLVDGGDVGDTYNWCPPDGDEPIHDPDGPATVTVLEGGPLRGRLRLDATYRGGAIAVSTVLELRAGERLVRVETTIDNRQRDHRLRVHLPLPEPTATSEAECAFAVVTRGLEAEGGPNELGLPTFPSRRFVRAGGLTVVHEGLLEYELVGVEHQPQTRATTLALTLLRCTGMLSQGPMRTRPLPAGPLDPLEGPQLQRRLTLRWGVAVGLDLDPYALVDDAFLPLETVPGGLGLAGADLPLAGQALAVEGGVVSALRRAPGGGVELRVTNPTPSPVTVGLPGRRGWQVDLLGRPGAPVDGAVALGPWQFTTVVLDAPTPG